MDIQKILKRANLTWAEEDLESLKKDFQIMLDRINNLQKFNAIQLKENYCAFSDDICKDIDTDAIKYLYTKNDMFYFSK